MPMGVGSSTIGNMSLIERLVSKWGNMAASTYDPVASGAALEAPRWPLFISGAVWLLFSFVILALDPTSVATVGIMIGILLLFGAVTEIVQMFVAPGWRWAHGLLAVVFLLTGLGAFASPYQTVGVLALFMGWFLLVKGTFDVFTSIAFRDEIPLWGLGLAVGIGLMLVGLWAIGYPGRSLALLLIWIGVGALLRGIGDIVLGFSSRREA
jgi:uncharacterized membrane protein HdeD (DUF308 family)